MNGVYEALAKGDVALVATDTVFGLAALPGSEGIERIYELKGRPADQPLPLLVSGVGMLCDAAACLQPYTLRLAHMFWPGALTLVVVGHGGKTVALRCPDSEVCLGLIERLQSPLACTSANLHGDPTPKRRQDLPACFSDLPGASQLPATCGDVASTIVDCTGIYPKILREGPIPAHVIWDVSTFDDTLA